MKSQSTFEFVAMISIGMVFFLIFILILNHNHQVRQDERNTIITKDLAYSLQTEFILAAKVDNGYYRSFNVPETLDGQDYNVSIQSNMLTIALSKQAYSLKVPDHIGVIKKGSNLIKKEDGVVKLNV